MSDPHDGRLALSAVRCKIAHKMGRDAEVAAGNKTKIEGNSSRGTARAGGDDLSGPSLPRCATARGPSTKIRALRNCARCSKCGPAKRREMALS